MNAYQLLKEAIKAVPSLKYALGVGGLVSVVAISGAITNADIRTAFVGAIVVIALMVCLVVFARLAVLASGILVLPAKFLLWSMLVLTVASSALLFTSVFFEWPLTLSEWLEGGVAKGGPKHTETRQVVRFTLEHIKFYNDGDGGLEGQGDFVWSFTVNGELLDANDKDVNFPGGHVEELHKSVDLDLEDFKVLQFDGRVVDKDGGMSGSDDRVPFSLSIDRGKLKSKSDTLRPAKGKGLDVEVAYRIELLSVDAARTQ